MCINKRLIDWLINWLIDWLIDWRFYLISLGSVKGNAVESDRKDLTSELELMKKLRRHPHVIELWGCVTKSGSRVVIGLIPPLEMNELRLYEPLITLTVPLLLVFRADDGDHRVCPVWRLAGLPEEEPRPERHLLQGPGCEAQDQPDVTAADEVRGAGGWRDGIFEFKQGGQTQESSNSQAKDVWNLVGRKTGLKCCQKYPPSKS